MRERTVTGRDMTVDEGVLEGHAAANRHTGEQAGVETVFAFADDPGEARAQAEEKLPHNRLDGFDDDIYDVRHDHEPDRVGAADAGLGEVPEWLAIIEYRVDPDAWQEHGSVAVREQPPQLFVKQGFQEIIDSSDYSDGSRRITSCTPHYALVDPDASLLDRVSPFRTSLAAYASPHGLDTMGSCSGGGGTSTIEQYEFEVFDPDVGPAICELAHELDQEYDIDVAVYGVPDGSDYR